VAKRFLYLSIFNPKANKNNRHCEGLFRAAINQLPYKDVGSDEPVLGVSHINEIKHFLLLPMGRESRQRPLFRGKTKSVRDQVCFTYSGHP